MHDALPRLSEMAGAIVMDLRGQVSPPTASLRPDQSTALRGEDARLHADQLEAPR